MTTTDVSIRTLIAADNDRFRWRSRKDWMISLGVHSKGSAFVQRAMKAVRAFKAFTEDNNPYGRRDAGVFTLSGERVFWKMIYFDGYLHRSTDDPSNPDAVRRVLTLMLASEY